MTPRVIDTGDSCVTLELEARIDPSINDACLGIAERVTRAKLPGVRDVVATYHTVAVHFDPLRLDRRLVVEELMRPAMTVAAAEQGRMHEVPVCYGGECGPDLEAVARFAQCTEDEVVTVHSAQTYRVYMIGFLPGFAYLGAVDPRIAMPRHDTPRLRVAAGSVGIAGIQTGIYPLETPAGWRIIGRTPVKPFDLGRPDPWLFRARDTIRFVPIARAAYLEAMETAGDGAR